MSEDREIGRVDFVFRLVVLLLAGLWIAFPPARDEGPTARPAASLTQLTQQ
ncbi:hypothetical protein [Terrarubrum flagellatum]|uniref:hypothetical protein n=1 Tax=Terrirubrum flagellatum TaxID=2895980 RepID=UPI003144D627